jgi:hypothetical protein
MRSVFEALYGRVPVPRAVESPYECVAAQIQTGDMIVWRGTGKGLAHRVVNKAIKNRTGPVTHVSTAIRSNIGGIDWLQIAEAAPQGLVMDSLARRLATGLAIGATHCWWFPMSEERRKKLNVRMMVKYLLRKIDAGTPYDSLQALRSSVARRTNRPDDTKLFCSEAHLAMLQFGGAVSNCNYSEVHPTMAVKFRLHAPTVYEIWRAPRQARVPLAHLINTVDPDNWRP